MVETIERDIFTVTRGIICHQVNMKGVMGKGIALEIKNRFPNVFKAYRDAYEHGELHLGMVQFVTAGKELYVGNLVGQNRYGSGQRCTDYGALRCAFQEVEKWSFGGLPVYIPYKIGCNNAGGDWATVKGIIELTIPQATICKLPKEG